MKRRLFFGLIVFFALAAANFAQTIDLNVKGVQIGTKYSDVLLKLGKPSSTIKGGFYPCDEGRMLTLLYPGLIIKLLEANDEPYFFVASMEINSRRWQIAPGINVGKNLNTIKERFSTSKVRSENGLKILPYYITDGYANFYFRNNELVKAVWELNVC